VGAKDWAAGVFAQALEAIDRIETDWELVQTVGTIIETAIRLGIHQERLIMVTGVIEVCGKRKKPGDRAKALAMLASALERVGEKTPAQKLLAQATEALNESREPSTISAASASIAEALAQLGEYDHALQMADGISGALDQAEAFGAIAASFVLAGQHERAMQMVGHLKMASCYRAIPHVMVVRALMQSGNIVGALLGLDDICDDHWQTWAIEAIASRDNEAAIQMYEVFHGTCPTIHAVVFTPETLQGALSAANVMKNHRNRFQVLSAIVRSLEKNQQQHDALEVRRRTVLACVGVLEASQRLDVNACACEAATHVCAALVDTKLYGEAQSAAATIQSSMERANVLLSIAMAAAADGDIVRTLGAAEQAVQVTCELSQPCDRIRLLCAVGNVMVTIKQIERAMQFLNHAIEEAGQLPSEDRPYRTLEAPNIDQSESFGIIAVTLAKVSDLQQALTMTNKVPNASHQVEVMESIIKVLIAGGNYEAAGEVVLRMQQTCGPSAPGKAWSAAVHARAGQANRASQLFGEALLFAQKKPAAPPWTIMRSLVAVTEALIEAGEFADRTAFLGSLIDLAARIRHYPSRGKALIKIVNAVQVAEKAEARVGLLLHALDAAATIKEDHWQAEVLTAIAMALSGVTDSAEFAPGMRRLVELAQGMAKACCQVEPLASAAATLAQTGHLLLANRLFEVAITISEKMEEELDRQQAIATIAAQIAHGDDPEQLRSLFTCLLKIALSIQDLGKRSNSLGVVLRASLKGEVRLTAQLLGHLESVALPEEVLGWIAPFSKTVSQAGETGIPLLRKAMLLSAQHLSLTLLLAAGTVAAHIRSGKTHRAKEIVRQCPQLGLAGILD
jgi:tetratricopeptide (TPR) repeat protein